jgi:hypothetical protein
MTERNAPLDRDDVLFAFHTACERPTPAQINEWVGRYPEFADDIRAHAAIRMEWADNIGKETESVEDEATALANGRSRALNILHKVQQATKKATPPLSAWQRMLTAGGFDVPALARHIDIDRMVLAELNAGRMRPPIGQRLVDALIVAFNVKTSELLDALAELLAGPRRLGHAKADSAPTILTRSYEEVILASEMPEKTKRYWLGEN